MMTKVFCLGNLLILMQKAENLLGPITASTPLQMQLIKLYEKKKHLIPALEASGYFKTITTTDVTEFVQWFDANGFPGMNPGGGDLFLGAIFKILEKWAVEGEASEEDIEISGRRYLAHEHSNFKVHTSGKMVGYSKDLTSGTLVMVCDVSSWTGHLSAFEFSLNCETLFNELLDGEVSAGSGSKLLLPVYFSESMISAEHAELVGLRFGNRPVSSVLTMDGALLNETGILLESAMAMVFESFSLAAQKPVIEIKEPLVMTAVKTDNGYQLVHAMAGTAIDGLLHVPVGSKKAEDYYKKTAESFGQ